MLRKLIKNKGKGLKLDYNESKSLTHGKWLYVLTLNNLNFLNSKRWSLFSRFWGQMRISSIWVQLGLNVLWICFHNSFMNNYDVFIVELKLSDCQNILFEGRLYLLLLIYCHAMNTLIILIGVLLEFCV